jgi:hypothetical protein
MAFNCLSADIVKLLFFLGINLMKVQIISTAFSVLVLGFTSISALAECGKEIKPISVLNFEAQAKQACKENPRFDVLLIRPRIQAINNFAGTKITCNRLIETGKTTAISVDRNPKLVNSIEVLGETNPDKLVEGQSEDGIVTYRVNLLKE